MSSRSSSAPTWTKVSADDERIQTTLSAPVVLDGKELSVGVSCGCACYPEDGDASQVRIAADSRMYETKQRHHENDRTEGEP